MYDRALALTSAAIPQMLAAQPHLELMEFDDEDGQLVWRILCDPAVFGDEEESGSNLYVTIEPGDRVAILLENPQTENPVILGMKEFLEAFGFEVELYNPWENM